MPIRFKLYSKNAFSKTTLHHAVEEQNINAIKYLIAYKPSLLDIPDYIGRTPLYRTAEILTYWNRYSKSNYNVELHNIMQYMINPTRITFAITCIEEKFLEPAARQVIKKTDPYKAQYDLSRLNNKINYVNQVFDTLGQNTSMLFCPINLLNNAIKKFEATDEPPATKTSTLRIY